MTVNNNDLFIPGKATVFVAEPNTPMPVGGINAFSLTGNPPAGWDNIGHTSKANTVSFSRDGGEKTTLDTYLQDAARTVYSSVAWGLTIPALQIGAGNLNLAFNGQFAADGGYIVPASVNPVDKALVLLFTDGTGKLGFYIPSNSLAIGDAPSFDPSAFLELPISSSIQSAAEAAIPAVNGVPGIMKVYKTGLVAVAPTVTGATPANAVGAAPVTIDGTGFLGATGVKFGSAAATYFDIVNDGRIVAIMPTGSAGSAAIKVTNAVGDSAAFAYNRGA